MWWGHCSKFHSRLEQTPVAIMGIHDARVLWKPLGFFFFFKKMHLNHAMQTEMTLHRRLEIGYELVV